MLELDKPEVRLTKDKGEMVVSVQTNEESVVAISNRDWITAVPEGKSVKLVYDENKVIGQRDAVVLVQAGDLVKALKVTQEGNALDVTTVPGLSYWSRGTARSPSVSASMARAGAAPQPPTGSRSPPSRGRRR